MRFWIIITSRHLSRTEILKTTRISPMKSGRGGSGEILIWRMSLHICQVHNFCPIPLPCTFCANLRILADLASRISVFSIGDRIPMNQARSDRLSSINTRNNFHFPNLDNVRVRTSNRFSMFAQRRSPDVGNTNRQHAAQGEVFVSSNPKKHVFD